MHYLERLTFQGSLNANNLTMALLLLFLLSGGLLYSILQNNSLREQQAQQLTPSFVISKPPVPQHVRKSSFTVPVFLFMVGLIIYVFFFATKTVRIGDEFGRDGTENGTIQHQPAPAVTLIDSTKKTTPKDDLADFGYP